MEDSVIKCPNCGEQSACRGGAHELASNGGIVLKITTPADANTLPNCLGALHAGIKCDGCLDSIRGLRYKCLVCPNYDLCGKCDSLALHSHHEMARVSGKLVNTVGNPADGLINSNS